MSFHRGFDKTPERQRVMSRCGEELDNFISHLPIWKRPHQEWSADRLTVTIWSHTQESLIQVHAAFKMFFSWRPAEHNGTRWCVTYRI